MFTADWIIWLFLVINGPFCLKDLPKFFSRSKLAETKIVLICSFVFVIVTFLTHLSLYWLSII